MDCPRCETALHEMKLDEVVLDRCAGCGGIWFDFAELERILSRESRALRELLPEGGAHEQPEEDSLRCPRCRGTLIRMRASPGRVIYYGCLTCYGRWLDGSVMERIVGRPLAVKYEELFKQLLDKEG